MKNNKYKNKTLKLFIGLFLVGIITSILYFNYLDKDDLNIFIKAIKESNILDKPINNITNHLKILSVITMFSIIFIGFPLCSGLIISEGFDLFFRVLLLYKSYKVKGIIYGVLYYLINNLIYILLLYIIFKRIIIICKKIYKYKIKKEIINLNEIYHLLIKIIYIIIIIFISDLLLYYYGSSLIKVFKSFCKI